MQKCSFISELMLATKPGRKSDRPANGELSLAILPTVGADVICLPPQVTCHSGPVVS